MEDFNSAYGNLRSNYRRKGENSFNVFSKRAYFQQLREIFYNARSSIIKHQAYLKSRISMTDCKKENNNFDSSAQKELLSRA